MVDFCIFTVIIFIILVIYSKILKYCWTTTMSIAVGVYYEVAWWFSFWVIQATFGASEEHYF